MSTVVTVLVVSGAQEPRLFGGEDAAAVFCFGMAYAGTVMNTLFD